MGNDSRVIKKYPKISTEVAYSKDDITTANAPSEAELIVAFGPLANIKNGFVGVLDDAGAATTPVFIFGAHNKYYYVATTQAS